MADRIQQRRDTAARWAQYNPILLEGEVGYELDTDQYKVGDGVNAWNALPYRGDPCVQQEGSSTTTPMSQDATTKALNAVRETAGADVGELSDSIFVNWVKLFEPTKIGGYCNSNGDFSPQSTGQSFSIKFPVKAGETLYFLQTGINAGFGSNYGLWEKSDGTTTLFTLPATSTKSSVVVPEDVVYCWKTVIFTPRNQGDPLGNFDNAYIFKTDYANITIDQVNKLNPDEVGTFTKDLTKKIAFEQAHLISRANTGGNLFNRWGILPNSGMNRIHGVPTTPFFNAGINVSGYAFSNKINIAGGQQVTFSKLPFAIKNTTSAKSCIYPCIAYFDADDKFMGYELMKEGKLTYTTLAGSAYFYVEVKYGAGEQTGYLDLGIYAGTTAPAIVFPYNVRPEFAPFDDWLRKITDVATFDLVKLAGWVVGYYDTPRVGETVKISSVTNTIYKCSPLLPVKPGEQLLLSGTGTGTGAGAGFVDSNGVYVGTFTVSVKAVGASQRVTVPEGAVYAVMNYEFGAADDGIMSGFTVRRVTALDANADADADADAVRASMLPSFIFNERLPYMTYVSLVNSGNEVEERNNALTGYIRGEIQTITTNKQVNVGSNRIKFSYNDRIALTSLEVSRTNANKVFGISPIIGKYRGNTPTNVYSHVSMVKVTRSDLEALGLNFVDDITTGVDITTGIYKLASSNPYWSGNGQVFIEIVYGSTEDTFLAFNNYWLGTSQLSYALKDNILYNGTYNPTNNADWITSNPGKTFGLTIRPYAFAAAGSDGGAWYHKIELSVYGSIVPRGGSTPVQFTGIQVSFLDDINTTKIKDLDVTILASFFNKHMEGLLTEATLPINIPDDLIQYMTKEEMMADGKIKPEYIPDFDTDNKKVVTVQNSDKIAMYGCSYTESYYALKKKSWINKLSNMLDIQLANFGVSGNRIVDINKRMRDNSNPYHSTIGIKEIKPTYIAIQNIGNETLNTSGNNLDFYLGEVEEAAELVKSYGAQLMLGTDWVIGNPSVDALLRDYADQNGYLYWGVGTISEKILANKYAGFWGGGHPATRTNATIWQEYLNFMRNLGVRQCIKVYRVRDEFKGGSPTIQDLNYDTIPQRMVKWNEINVGEIHLSETAPGWNYYDRLNETASGGGWAYKVTRANNEYCNLIAKQNVAFNNWGLVEFILPVVKTDLVKAYIKSADTGLKFYVKQSADKAYQYGTERNYCMFKVEKSVYDNFATVAENTQYNSSNTGTAVLQYKGRLKGYDYPGYYLCFYNSTNSTNASGGAGTLTAVAGGNAIAYISASSGLGRHLYGFFDSCLKPLANFEEIASVYNAATGYYEIDITDYKYMQYDKLRVIVGKTGAFNISDVYCSAEGGIEKRIDKNIFKPLKRQGTELMTDTGMGATYNDQWELTDGAAFGTIPAAINQYPGFHSAYKSFIKLGYDAENFPGVMKKTFTIDEARGYRDVIVRVTARLFPKVYDTTKTPDDTYTNVQQITPSSYDLATLCVGLKMGTSTPSVERRMVDVDWAELEIRTCIPPYVTNMEVTLWRDDRDLENSDYKSVDWPLQVCDVSVQTIES
nr:MAG TPA: hyaluronidase [Caudoviricetes sp.]